MEWVTEYCNRAMLLEKGRVVAEGDPAEVVRIHQEHSAQRKAEKEAAGVLADAKGPLAAAAKPPSPAPGASSADTFVTETLAATATPAATAHARRRCRRRRSSPSGPPRPARRPGRPMRVLRDPALLRRGERVLRRIGSRLGSPRDDALIAGAEAAYALVTGRRVRGLGISSHKEPSINRVAYSMASSASRRATMPTRAARSRSSRAPIRTAPGSCA